MLESRNSYAYSFIIFKFKKFFKIIYSNFNHFMYRNLRFLKLLIILNSIQQLLYTKINQNLKK